MMPSFSRMRAASSGTARSGSSFVPAVSHPPCHASYWPRSRSEQAAIGYLNHFEAFHVSSRSGLPRRNGLGAGVVGVQGGAPGLAALLPPRRQRPAGRAVAPGAEGGAGDGHVGAVAVGHPEERRDRLLLVLDEPVVATDQGPDDL